MAAPARRATRGMSMLTLLLTYESGKQQTVSVNTPLTIGRAANSGLRIRNWRVSGQHARLNGRGQTLEIEDLGSLFGTWVNGRRVTVHRPVLPDDAIVIGPCRIYVRPDGETSQGEACYAIAHSFEAICANRMEPGSCNSTDDIGLDGDLARPARTNSLPTPAPSDTPNPSSPAAHDGPESSTKNAPGIVSPVDIRVCVDGADRNAPADARLQALRQRLHTKLREALDLRRRDIASMSDVTLREVARTLLETISVDADARLTDSERESICREVLDEALGLGPLEALLHDPTITEIMVNRYDEIYVEREGRLSRHKAVFSSEQSVRWAIERIVAPVGRRIDESSPMVDARLSDGSRVNAVIPPIALKGASLTIRKFPSSRPKIADLIGHGSMSPVMADFLMRCVQTRKNIVVSGGTGAGKTTLLNALVAGIPGEERIVTIEDAAELMLEHGNWVALESRPANLEHRGRIDIRDLVRNALRMRPDRIIVGECRGAEAFDMLTAMNTGHEGSLTTLHANSPRDALSRLESMVLIAGMDLPLPIVREHIAASLDLVVQVVRLADGRRVVHSIAEITGMEGNQIQVQELFRHTRTGSFRESGLVPTFIDEWREAGVAFDGAAFGSAATKRPQGIDSGADCRPRAHHEST
ncbi:ATPase, T2SS/T4P/T4SS family [Bordetella sp. 02P26C-1]|uniref:ATPase, T2SS/T4P/T4SS family n=1 Tax=Bordetella sp. 02P26C-1 TaxID=2683195 RepID=UPI003FA45167